MIEVTRAGGQLCQQRFSNGLLAHRAFQKVLLLLALVHVFAIGLKAVEW